MPSDNIDHASVKESNVSIQNKRMRHSEDGAKLKMAADKPAVMYHR